MKAASIRCRAGVSLFEVVLAMGLFATALAALSQLHVNGTNSAIQSRLLTQAVMRCESKLNEIAAAVEPLQAIADAPFDDDGSWTWSLQTAVGPHPDVMLITVTVKRNGQSNLDSTSFSLSRLIRDPLSFQVAAPSEGTTP